MIASQLAVSPPRRSHCAQDFILARNSWHSPAEGDKPFGRPQARAGARSCPRPWAGYEHPAPGRGYGIPPATPNLPSTLAVGTAFESDIPARLDRLPWSRWHWRIVIALGITWVLDGLEVTLVGAVSGILGEHDTLHLSESQIGACGSAYLTGAIIGALAFGRLSDQFGRRRLFMVTLSLYLTATVLTALANGFVTFALFRALTGAGIGGEYAAIKRSAIDELLPARVRGRADLGINSTYWLGTALGASASLVLLNPHILPHSIGWRACFGLGAILSFGILFVRRHLPERAPAGCSCMAAFETPKPSCSRSKPTCATQRERLLRRPHTDRNSP